MTDAAPTQIAAYQPAEPFLREHKRRPDVKRDGIVAWLEDEIAWLESITRTDNGDGALSAYKTTLREIKGAE